MDTSLPIIREDLCLVEGEPLRTGASSWLIHDRVQSKYYRIDERAVRLMGYWSLGDAEQILRAVNRGTDEKITPEDIEAMVHFLHANRLTVTGPDHLGECFADQEAAASPPWWRQMVHKYLFVRVPLFYPDPFLRATMPLVRPLFSKAAWWIIALAGVLALFLVSRQWNSFVETFLHFLSFEGAIFYALTLIAVTGLHELGHAYTAHYYKCRVQTIGIAFLVMFPVLYTDTTDAWRLKNPRQRLHIDIAGIAAELMIAIIATLLWSFLPDGPWRSAMFFIATTSWTLSLIINLNPFMRFDGYYIFSDLIGIENLQARSFALGRWKLRELLFGLGVASPEVFSRWHTRGLVLFAWGTWVYRFFLFLGIALFVHAFFAKALGIILFVIEIGWFIAKPVANEIGVWIACRKDIIKTWRSRLSLAGIIGFFLILFVPWQATIKAPAILTPTLTSEIYASHPGQLIELNVRERQYVRAGELLFVLDFPEIDYLLRQTEISIGLLQTRLDRLAGDHRDRSESPILRRALISERERANGFRRQLAQGRIVAPHDGIIAGLHRDIATGQWLHGEQLLARLVAMDGVEIVALPGETQIARLDEGSRVIFIADDVRSGAAKAGLGIISVTAKASIDKPVFSSAYGGRIAIREDINGDHIPDNAVFEVRALPEVQGVGIRTVTGVAIIKARRQAPIIAIWRRISAVLVREADF